MGEVNRLATNDLITFAGPHIVPQGRFSLGHAKAADVDNFSPVAGTAQTVDILAKWRTNINGEEFGICARSGSDHFGRRADS